MKKILCVLVLIISLIGCQEKNNTKSENEFEINGKTYAIDTIMVSNNANIKYFEESDITTQINFNDSTGNALGAYKSTAELNNLMIKNSEQFSDASYKADWKSSKIQEDYLKNNNLDFSYLNSDCYENRPTTIQDLSAGLSLRAYKFDKNNQGSLSLFGFGNISLGRKEKVVLVEFLQTGNYVCQENKSKYGVGARMMMKITSKKNRAKINSPQQISASVTFGLAEVEFSVITIGITGPGTASLVNQGSMTENTYSNFLKSVSNLIVDVYKTESSFLIDPQLIPEN